MRAKQGEAGRRSAPPLRCCSHALSVTCDRSGCTAQAVPPCCAHLGHGGVRVHVELEVAQREAHVHGIGELVDVVGGVQACGGWGVEGERGGGARTVGTLLVLCLPERQVQPFVTAQLSKCREPTHSCGTPSSAHPPSLPPHSPIMCTPRISPVSLRYISLAMPSDSSSARLLLLACAGGGAGGQRPGPSGPPLEMPLHNYLPAAAADHQPADGLTCSMHFLVRATLSSPP